MADLLVVTPEFRRAIEGGGSAEALPEALPAERRPMREALLELLFGGEIAPEEVDRILALEEA